MKWNAIKQKGTKRIHLFSFCVPFPFVNCSSQHKLHIHIECGGWGNFLSPFIQIFLASTNQPTQLNQIQLREFQKAIKIWVTTFTYYKSIDTINLLAEHFSTWRNITNGIFSSEILTIILLYNLYIHTYTYIATGKVSYSYFTCSTWLVTHKSYTEHYHLQ